MILSGVQKISLIDYPGKVACVVFTAGCNLRCRFCHNPEFVLPERIKEISNSFIAERDFFAFLEKRRGLLDGVSICGGEPTLQTGLLAFIQRVKSFGLLVKVDTNGSNPKILEKFLEEKLVDYIAMDIKHTWEKYSLLTGVEQDIASYKRSTEMIMKFAPDYEFRTTVIGGTHSERDIEEITTSIYGARRYILQNYRPGDVLDPHFVGTPFSHEELLGLRSLAASNVSICEIRE